MGFPLMGSWVSHVCVRNYEKSTKFRPLFENERFTVNIRCSKFKPSPRRISLCKSELVDFDDRTSPNETWKGSYLSGFFKNGTRSSTLLTLQALELGREVAKLLDCTSWMEAGPGLMDAAIKGALEAGKPVGGFKIAKEVGEWTASNFHPYLPSETYLTCRFFSARKHGLVDAAVRNKSSDRTAVVALPGGIGTLDEMFEILALIQLERIGSELPVPFIVMNYDSFYQKLLDFIQNCEDWGTVSRGEVASLWKICNNNSEALAYLKDFYKLHSSSDKDGHDKKLTSAL